MNQFQFFTYEQFEASPSEWSVNSPEEAFAIINGFPKWAQPNGIILREETPCGVNMMWVFQRVGNGIWLHHEDGAYPIETRHQE